MKIICLAKRQDSDGRPLSYRSLYILKKKVDDQSFFGGGSLSVPTMVADWRDAHQVDGSRLENMVYDWTKDWTAIEIKYND